ncbi:hypothetical protein ACVXG7_20585 [Enterobacter hormaechei]
MAGSGICGGCGHMQGEQLAAYSDKNKFCITSLSSMKTAIPKKLTWCNWSNPLYPAGMAALFCVLSLIAYRIGFLAKTIRQQSGN